MQKYNECIYFSIVPNLYYKNDEPNLCETTLRAIVHKNKYLRNMFTISLDIDISENNFIKSLPTPYRFIGSNINCVTEKSLSRIVSFLSQSLLTSTSKYFTVSIFYFTKSPIFIINQTLFCFILYFVFNKFIYRSYFMRFFRI